MNGSQIVGGGSTPNPGNYWSIAGTGDFNGDGRTDILWRGQGAEVVVWEMDGSQIIGGGSTPNPGSYWTIAG
jgi:serralysin